MKVTIGYTAEQLRRWRENRWCYGEPTESRQDIDTGIAAGELVAWRHDLQQEACYPDALFVEERDLRAWAKRKFA